MGNGNAAPTELSQELVTFLQGPKAVLVTTLDAETKWPTNNLITWVFAKDGQTLRLVTDSKGRVLNNIRSDDRVLLTVIAHGACHTIEGTARVVKEEIEGVTLKLGCAEVAVRAVRDVTFWGGKLLGDVEYDVTYDKALKEKLDSGVFAAMQSL
jgi:hypothetical protein